MTVRHLPLLLLLVAGSASAQLKLDWRGYVQSDVRITTTREVSFERIENWGNVHLQGRYGKHIAGVMNLSVIWTEFGQPQDFAALTKREVLDPVRFESDALFVEFRDIGVDGLDFRLGRQQIIWGTADRFHPTSNVNPLDVQDPLDFGKTVAQEAFSLRYRPYVVVGDEDEPWFEEPHFELVWAPIFKPAQLPDSAGLAFVDPAEQVRLANHPQIKELARQNRGYAQGGASVNYDVTMATPDFEIANSAYGARAGFSLFGFDLSFSYFSGFEDFPRAEKVVVSGDANDVQADVTLSYARIQVIGVDLTTSLDWADGIGLWTEVGITLHDDLWTVIDGTRFVGNEPGFYDTSAPGEAPNMEFINGPTFANGPIKEWDKGFFVKAVVGMDYTPFAWWYINVQYLHGFIDEFGADDLEDYLVGNMDFKMANQRVTLRIAAILNFQDQSHVIFPQLIIKPFTGAEFTVGAFLYSGLWANKATKFGSPVAGQSTVFTRARFSF